MKLIGSLTHDRYCDEILAQTDLFRQHLRGVDLTATVPTCPEWTVDQLARHLGGAHRWVGAIVGTRAKDNIPPEEVPGGAGPEEGGLEALDAWLEEGVRTLVETLREAGPDAEVWGWMPGQAAGFWARRMAHETVVHRADAAITAGVDFEVAPEVAADTIEEWLQMLASPVAKEFNPALSGVLGPGRTIHLHATDAPAELNAEWLIDLTGEWIAYRRGHEKAAVVLRGPLTDVLRVFYRRQSADTERVEILGDRKILDHWLELASFG
ncbi:maleylpyruvate isomerase family mycothiol-dependent enzyme [Streptomyces sp. NPDC003077]|uniref:maleylpyruvate isomerase family mycothiol-dependent enzyme n=1 Tax=Streptomyces sp. NPDC003077 TaxID=3154443 RepID=UPI0033A94A19